MQKTVVVNRYVYFCVGDLQKISLHDRFLTIKISRNKFAFARQCVILALTGVKMAVHPTHSSHLVNAAALVFLATRVPTANSDVSVTGLQIIVAHDNLKLNS